MVNEMRKFHLEQKAQRPEKRSPALMQLSNELLAGNDDKLGEMGNYLVQAAKLAEDPRYASSVESTRNSAEMRAAAFTDLFEKLTPEQKTSIRETISQRMRFLEAVSDLESKKRSVALAYLLERFGE